MLHVMVATATVWIAIALVATVALVLTAALASARGHRLERRMAAELGRRWNEHRPFPQTPEPMAGGETAATPEGPDAELRITLDQLLEQRDALLEEFQDVQVQIQFLKKEVERRRRFVAVPADPHEPVADVIVLRDATSDDERQERRR